MTSLHLDLLAVPHAAALANYVLHQITRMLEDSSYVRCSFIDYSRAFDTVNHELLYSQEC